MRQRMGLRAAMLCGAVGLLGLASASHAQVNGWNVNQVSNGTGSTATITNTNTNPNATVTINDGNATFDGPTSLFDVFASEDNGATAATIPTTDSFTISMNVTLDAGSLSPRKEAGIRINGTGANAGNDGQFIIDSDAGEIVAFSGNAPFALFGNNSDATNNTNGTGDPFVNDQTIFMEEEYSASAGTLTYIARDVTTGGPIMVSGPNVAYTMPGPSQIGVYTQWGAASPSDSDNVTFSNLSISLTPTPEPASLGMLALGGFGLLARRRKLA